MAEQNAGLAVVAEPYYVPPNNPRWMSNRTGRVAIIWRPTESPIPYGLLSEGEFHVAVKWGDYFVVGVYIPPSTGVAQLEHFLDHLGGLTMKWAPSPVIIAGDFNAKSHLWGSPATDVKGHTLGDWAASLGLMCLNTGTESTCVRPQGESIIDITWASPPAAARVRGWRVATEILSESDHLYIEVVLQETPAQARGRAHPQPRRWALKRLDEDIFEACIRAGMPSDLHERVGDPGDRAAWLQALISRACDAAAPRISPRQRRATYWWDDRLEILRRSSHRAYRALKRARRKRNTPSQQLEGLRLEYRSSSKALRIAIGEAKARAWEDLVLTLDENPWGRPYQIVMNKLRRWAPPLTESLDPPLLNRVLDTLFPEQSGEVVQWIEPPHTQEEGGVGGHGGRDGRGHQEDVKKECRSRTERHPRPNMGSGQ